MPTLKKPLRFSGVVEAETLVAAIHAGEGPIEVVSATIGDPVTFRSIEFRHRLTMTDTTFLGKVDLEDARLGRTVDLTGSTFKAGLSMGGAHVGGSLVLDRARIEAGDGPTRLYLLRVGGDFRARGLEVTGPLDLALGRFLGVVDLSSSVELDGPPAGALRLRMTRCAGLLMNGIRADGDVSLRGVEIDGPLNLEVAVLRGSLLGGPLTEPFETNETGGRVVQVGRFRGLVNLAGCQVAGTVDLAAARIGGDLNLQSAEVRSGVFCRSFHGRAPSVGGTVWGPGLNVESTADFCGLIVERDVRLDGMRLRGSLILSNELNPKIGLLRPGYLIEPGNRLIPEPDLPTEPPPRPVDQPTIIRGNLKVSNASIEGLVRARDIEVDGKIYLQGTRVSDYVDLSGGKVGLGPGVSEPGRVSVGGKEIAASAAEPTGGLNRRDSLIARRSRISGGLYIGGLRLKEGMTLQGARVVGEIKGARVEVLDLLERPLGLAEIGGTVFLAGAEVFGDADLVETGIDGNLVLERARVLGKLRCPNRIGRTGGGEVARGGPILNLKNSAIRHLDLERIEGAAQATPSRHPPPDRSPSSLRFILDGAEFQELSVANDDGYLSILLPPEGTPFRRSNFVRLEKFFRDRGEEVAAAKVFKAMRRAEPRSTWFQHVGHAFNDLALGLISRFRLLMLVLATSIVVTAVVFGPRVSVQAKDQDRDPNLDWGWTDAAWMSFHLHVPMLELPVEERWLPSTEPIELAGARFPLTYEHLALEARLVGYILFPFILTGIATSWLRKSALAEK